MKDMEQFFTPEKAKSGTKVPLFDHAGEKTEHYLIVRSVECEEYRVALHNVKRDFLVKMKSENDSSYGECLEQNAIDLNASLVADWSFEQECTFDNVVKFLKRARHVVDEIDQFARERTNFFTEKSKNSTNTPKQK